LPEELQVSARLSWRSLAGGALGVVAVVVLATLLDSTPRIVRGEHEDAIDPRPAAHGGDVAPPRSESIVPPEAAAPSPSELGARRPSPRLVDDLVETLEAIDASTPEVFHEPAARALEDFARRVVAAGATDVERRRDLVPPLIDALDRTARSPRVRGAILAAIGGLGDVDVLLDAMPTSGEEQRSALIGLAWDPLHEPDSKAAMLRPDELVSGRRKYYRELKLDVLPLPLTRLASDRARAWLPNAVIRPITDEPADALAAELAALALGTAVDADPSVLAFFAARLTDANEDLRYLREVALYVLSRAASPAAKVAFREALLASATGPLDAIANAASTRWLATKRLDSETIRAIARPLSSPEPPRTALEATPAILAIGTLVDRLQSGKASPEELAEIESVLATSAAREHDPRLHLVVVSSLAESPGSDARLFTLEGVLRGDPDAACRRWAANGLGRTTGELAEPARAMLRRALSGETDPDVRAEIAKALDSPR
jgi:hypothetical protein